MNDDTPEFNLDRVYDLLMAAFTGKTLPRFLRRNPSLKPILNRFGPGQGLDDMVDEVIEYCEKHALLHELLVAVSRENPGQYVTHHPNLGRSAPIPPARTDARVAYRQRLRRYWMIALAVVLIAATGVAIVILRFAKGLPVPAPIPMPVIERFDVDPLEITEGDTVRLSWKVTGADTVSIDPLGREVLLQGDMSDQPWALTTYRLTARKIAPDGSEARNSVSAQVIVNPAPTPTPEPQAPIVQLFEATPTEIVAGDRTEVMLTWSVSGNTTDIQIVGAGVPLTGLSLQDSISLSISDDVFFVLTAYNGDQSSSKHVQIRTVEPTPAPLDTPVPPTPKDTSTPTWTPTPTHAPTNTPTSMWTPTPTHTPTDTPTPTPRPRDMHLIIELDEAPTPFDSHAGVLWAIFSPNVVKYIIPKPQYCGGGLYAGDPKVIYWSPDQENVEHGLSAGQLIELYGECFFDAGQPAVTIPPDAPYFLRIYEW